MANYFKHFPSTIYNVSDNPLDTQIVSNILTRFNFDSRAGQVSSLFYLYTVKDGETPEILAYTLYKDSEKHWMILLANQIIDPQFDWPLDYRTFNQYIEKKYFPRTANTSFGSGLSWALSESNIHSYYKVITTRFPNSIIPPAVEKYEVDAELYADDIAMEITSINEPNEFILPDQTIVTISVTKETKTYYEYENELNESRRNIRLIRPEYVSELEKEFKRVIKII
jgi:hypothetical protein